MARLLLSLGLVLAVASQASAGLFDCFTSFGSSNRGTSNCGYTYSNNCGYTYSNNCGNMAYCCTPRTSTVCCTPTYDPCTGCATTTEPTMGTGTISPPYEGEMSAERQANVDGDSLTPVPERNNSGNSRTTEGTEINRSNYQALESRLANLERRMENNETKWNNKLDKIINMIAERNQNNGPTVPENN